MFLFIVLIIQLNSFVSESMDIVINSETGNDLTCLMTTTTPCSSLEYVAQALQGNLSDINIRIDGNLTLGPSEVIRFEDASNLTISGRASEIQCHENVSFHFHVCLHRDPSKANILSQLFFFSSSVV